MAAKSKVDPNVVNIVVDGLSLDIDTSVRATWRFLVRNRDLLRAEEEKDETQVLVCSVDVIEMLIGDQMDKVLKHLGPDPTYMEVRDFGQKVIAALNAKNL